MVALLLLLLTICSAGSSADFENKEKRYGRHLRFPARYTPPSFRGQVYFTPSDGGPTKLLLDDGLAMDPRIEIRELGVFLTGLRESDAGMYSESPDWKKDKFISLKVLDCSTEITNTSGARITFDVPTEAQYLQFTPLYTNDTRIVWHQDDPLFGEGGRGQMTSLGWEIINLAPADSGYYDMRRKDYYLVSRIKLTVKDPIPTYVYVAIAGGIVLAAIVCFCCVRKCCCKKGSSKRDESVPAAVYYHSRDQNQPAGPNSSAAPPPDYSYHSVKPPAYEEAAATSAGPSVHNQVNVHVNPLQPEVSAPSLGSDFLSSAPPPELELKGRTFPSAPHLGSESTTSDVYTSDKLNFR